MKTRIFFILIFLCLASCQQKSEIDECVEAKLEKEFISNCEPAERNPPGCKLEVRNNFETNFRQICLREQAGR
jgi:hypothetical protein